MSSRSSPDVAAMPLPASLAIHLDLVGGIAGDMFVAAMADALPALATRMLAELALIQPADLGMPAFPVGSSGGLRARRFALQPRSTAGGASVPHDHGAHDHGAHDEDAPDHDHGTAYTTLRGRIADSRLPAGTRAHALALLDLLAHAEADVHGIGIDAVPFHELADWDSLLDVVAAGCIADALDGAAWTASALPLGGGTVRTRHGLLPVPTPATSGLLVGYPWRDDGIGGERVTPTGAAILRHLVPAAACGARRGEGRLRAVGTGAGTRELAGAPNLVRAFVVERAAAADAATSAADAVTVIEFDIDDMSGEEIALAADRLRAVPGTIDVSVGMRQGKKGRPVADFRLLARPDAQHDVACACFTETSTLGLRLRDERRRTLARADMALPVAGAVLQVKVAERPGGARTAKAAHDDVAAAPGLAARRAARAAAERQAVPEEGK